MPSIDEVQVITLGAYQDGESSSSSSSTAGREGQSAERDSSADSGGNDSTGTQAASADSGDSEHSGSTDGTSGQPTIKQFQLVSPDGTVYGTTNLTVSDDGTVSMLVSPQQVQIPETYYVDTLNYSFFSIVALVVILAFVGIVAGAAVSRTLHASLEKFG